MKFFQDFIVAILLIASAQAAGSGPYLPSGWRPDGPAFLLPGEINESPAVPLKSAQESLAAGSISLREYGPPKLEELSQDITQQALPDEADGPPFYIIRTDFNEELNESEHDEATTEQEIESDKFFSTTEATVDDNTETQSKIESNSTKLDSEDVTEVTSKDSESEYNVEETEKTSDGESGKYKVSKTEQAHEIRSNIIESVKGTAEVSVQVKSDKVTSDTSANDDVVFQTKEPEMKSDMTESLIKDQVKAVYDVDDTKTKNSRFSQVKTEEFKKEEESDRIDFVKETANASNEIRVVEKDKDEKKDSGVNNISEALVYLEKEIKDQQHQEDAEVKKVADVVGTRTGQPIPEGFLEYGPPGFKEYGPPAPVLSKVVEVQPSTKNDVDIGNEVRRRRFSPKFKTKFFPSERH